MKYTITTLVENTVDTCPTLVAEYGLSFSIETEKHHIIFDTGQGLALLNNAAQLHVDLTQIDSVVLSHGHIDHAGGLTQLIAKSRSLTLYAHPRVFENKLLLSGSEDARYVPIGVASERAAIEGSGIRMVLSDQPIMLSPGIMTSGRIPMNSSYEEIEPVFYVGQKGRESPDFIEDDMALILDSDQGSVVMLGCTHRGIINTLNHVAMLTGKKKIHAVMGGLHLLHADTAKLDKIITGLEAFDIDRLIVGHCTGSAAIERLRYAFADRLIINSAGLVQTY